MTKPTDKPVGIMQGRLVPKLNNRYQAFPVGYWEAEFHIARELGFQNIEFILDYGSDHLNPLMSEEGISHLKDVIKDSKVGVVSICADYFMEAPFHSPKKQGSEKILTELIKNSAKLGVKDIVIPCVDHAALKTNTDEEALIDSVKKAIPLAKDHGIFLNLETDLAPKPFAILLDKIDSAWVKVNYDIGNSSGIGYGPTEEFAAYGDFISDLHIKDRALKGASVKLGTGNANFDTVFTLLKKHNFKGNITMQASRSGGDYASELPHVKEQLEYTRLYIERFLA